MSDKIYIKHHIIFSYSYKNRINLTYAYTTNTGHVLKGTQQRIGVSFFLATKTGEKAENLTCSFF
jgi:hypothetical protein